MARHDLGPESLPSNQDDQWKLCVAALDMAHRDLDQLGGEAEDDEIDFYVPPLDAAMGNLLALPARTIGQILIKLDVALHPRSPLSDDPQTCEFLTSLRADLAAIGLSPKSC